MVHGPKSVPMTRATWLKVYGALLLFLGLSCGALLLAGRRFALEQVFYEINTLVQQDRERDVWIRQQLALATHPKRREDLKDLLAKSPGGSEESFICIDAATQALFSLEQQCALENSLKAEYDHVFWGEAAIPDRFRVKGHDLKNGYVISFRLKVYPGVVKIHQHHWSGLLSGGGQTTTYLWKGWGFRQAARSVDWRA